MGHHRRGHRLAVAAIRIHGHPTHPLLSSLAQAGVSVHEVTVGPREYLRERRFVADVCRSFRPQVVHTHGYRADVIDRGAAAGLGIPTVTTVHGPSMVGGLRGAFYEWLQRVNYRRFDGVVAVSRMLYDESLRGGVRADRLRLIHNAWGGLNRPLSRSDARRELGLGENDVVVGWVGRLIPVKGGDVFVSALARLPEPRPVVAMIGHGIEGERLARQVAEAGLSERVRFYPDVDQAGRLFGAFDTYVLSSHSEGLPVVVLEAMAAGTPIVATRVGGVPEALGEGEALLVPPGDPEALARAIQRSLVDPAGARDRAASAGRRLAAEFALEPWLDRYEEVYRRVVR